MLVGFSYKKNDNVLVFYWDRKSGHKVEFHCATVMAHRFVKSGERNLHGTAGSMLQIRVKLEQEV